MHALEIFRRKFRVEPETALLCESKIKRANVCASRSHRKAEEVKWTGNFSATTNSSRRMRKGRGMCRDSHVAASPNTGMKPRRVNNNVSAPHPFATLHTARSYYFFPRLGATPVRLHNKINTRRRNVERTSSRRSTPPISFAARANSTTPTVTFRSGPSFGQFENADDCLAKFISILVSNFLPNASCITYFTTTNPDPRCEELATNSTSRAARGICRKHSHRSQRHNPISVAAINKQTMTFA